ncbi:hypothetical protein J3Q64DRAFT_1709026 [Phycomyces blakesleeanus]|uniref:MARVEL domain-containing protein n=2 Tax=Phycomyces blakesleeanus TaxID=4837 RepID=A0A167KHY0_PHYB8|nr:hypothetical protein PHYBLDRAFT_79404 [Phycomyces blakesleeanus NRRL 1555(-)]OAD68145.1 hypothetical protein PHYBLDRAFT_79404 [Phycomyces blakesleeanus NRRL 1555(-)]|eukprot:XP_018286185.1 hypothetical protein PHYBLDRAFT_79404 [Phycomyces blakesleeanus NRRL 1555(-)]
MGSSKSCCCCIPLRAGVMVIAIVSSAFYISSLVYLLIRRSDMFAKHPDSLNFLTPIFWTSVAVVSVYSISSILGVFGSISQNRAMTAVFRVLYWIMAILILVVSVAGWVLLLVNRDSWQDECANYVSKPDSDIYSIVKVPSGSEVATVLQNACSNDLKTILIVSGIAVVMGNIIQIYFASVVSSYASRLKRGNKHIPLRNLDDFPDNSHKNMY